jgi:hypothetical protein
VLQSRRNKFFLPKRKTAPATFKMRQQNFRHASKIINPNDFDMPRKKRGKLENIHLVGWSWKIPFTHVSLIPGVVFSSYGCLDNGTWDNAPPQNA